MKIEKVITFSRWILSIILSIILFCYIYLSETRYSFVNNRLENKIATASAEMNNLVSILIGKISKSEILKYYSGIGKSVDEENEGVLYFNGLGYKFDGDSKLERVYPRIVGFQQVMPN